MTDNYLTSTAFSALPLPEPLLRGLADLGFSHCTPIQSLTLPVALNGADVAGQAQTGTGKTIAFLLAVYAHLLRVPGSGGSQVNHPRAFIMAPTRELAVQIHKDAETLGCHTGLRLGLVYGGTGYDSQRTALTQGVDVVIGTPGRLIDFLKQGIYHLKSVQVMVLDEADRMFDLGFIADVRYLLRRMPPPHRRQSLLFSATLSWRVHELAYEHMNNPQLLQVAPDRKTVEQVRQQVYYTANEDKVPLLIGLLRQMDAKRSIVFVNTKAEAEKLRLHLVANEVKAGVLSGDVPQTKRLRLLSQFQHGELPVLVATDVAARGLHIPEVSHVFNFDLPQDAEDYVHRIGRTARAGAAGEAVSFACERYAFFLPEIETFLNSKIPVADVTGELLATVQTPTRQESPHHHRPFPPRGNRNSGRRRSAHSSPVK